MTMQHPPSFNKKKIQTKCESKPKKKSLTEIYII